MALRASRAVLEDQVASSSTLGLAFGLRHGSPTQRCSGISSKPPRLLGLARLMATTQIHARRDDCKELAGQRKVRSKMAKRTIMIPRTIHVARTFVDCERSSFIIRRPWEFVVSAYPRDVPDARRKLVKKGAATLTNPIKHCNACGRVAMPWWPQVNVGEVCPAREKPEQVVALEEAPKR